MQPNSLSDAQIRKVREKTVRALNRVHKMFPHIERTRFKGLSDYYSLVVLVAKLEEEGFILTEGRRNRLALDILVAFSTGVDDVAKRLKDLKGAGPDEELYRQYLLTVREATDEISHRRRREAILRGLLESLFARKDSDRLFSEIQRRVLWNSAASRKCAHCNRVVSWEDFTADHIKPHSQGGRTALDNAALMHRRCNSAKGGR
jgi:5-methylcytosine-specific restriction endonuclease McrA